MTAPTSQTPDAGCAPPASAGREVEDSCRLPVLALFTGAALWLVVAAVLALVASIKFHDPGFLAGSAWFTYGRVHPAHLNVLAYGFAAQAGLGVTLWLLARTGKSRLRLPGPAFLAAGLWNLGIAVGVLDILRGHNTGIEFLEFGQTGSVFLFLAYLILALSGLLTFARRAESGCVSQTFLVVALFWFPWVYVTATALLGCAPVRGVAQAVIAWWFAGNFLFVWLGLIGLGALFHFVPAVSGRALHSRPLALLALSVLIFFGSWTGVPATAPLPAWIPALSSVGAFLSVIALLAVLVNFKLTAGKCLCAKPEPVPKFFGLSVWMFALFVLGQALTAFNRVASVTAFSWVTPVLHYLLLYGFAGLVLLGAIYHIAPQLTRSGYPSRRLVSLHFWLALAGTVLLAGSLAVAGVRQGRLLQDASVPFADVTRAGLMPFRLGTLGDLFILLGALTLLFNLGGLIRAGCRRCCGVWAESGTTEGKR